MDTELKHEYGKYTFRYFPCILCILGTEFCMFTYQFRTHLVCPYTFRI
jgi:hypothetical protein